MNHHTVQNINKTPSSHLYRIAITTAGIFFSKILGLFRDASIAWILGNAPLADILTAALRIPFFFRRLLGDGLLSFALTKFCLYENIHNNSGVERTIRISQLLAGIAFITVSILIIFPKVTLSILIPGIDENNFFYSDAIVLFRICLPYSIFAILTAGNIAILHSKKHFFMPALSPIIFNCILLITIFLSINTSLDSTVKNIAYGVFIGGLLQYFILIPPINKIKKIKQPQAIPFRKLAQTAMNIFTACMPQLTFIIAAMLASFLPSGYISTLFYAERLIEFPTGILSGTIGITTLPALTLLYKDHKHASIAHTLSTNTTLICGINIPAALGLMALSSPLVHTIYFHGSFDLQAAQLTSFALCAYAPSIPAIALARLFLTGCYATNTHKQPFIASIMALFLCCLLGFIFLNTLQILGPPIGISLGLWVYCYCLFRILKSRLTLLKLQLKPIGIQLLASICMFITAYTPTVLLSHISPELQIVISLPVGIITYYLFLFYFDKPQINQIKSLLK